MGKGNSIKELAARVEADALSAGLEGASGGGTGGQAHWKLWRPRWPDIDDTIQKMRL
jgi:hypothetical protein